MTADLQRQQAHTAARDVLLRHIPHAADQAAQTIVTELADLVERRPWVLTAGIARRMEHVTAYATLESAYGLDRNTVDAAVVAAANRLGQQY